VLHGLAAICHEAGNGGYIGSHCPKQLRASSLLGGGFSSASGLALQPHPSRANRNWMSLPARNSEELFWIAGLDLVVLFPSALMGKGWDGGDDPSRLNPLPPGERKLCITRRS